MAMIKNINLLIIKRNNNYKLKKTRADLPSFFLQKKRIAKDENTIRCIKPFCYLKRIIKNESKN